MEIEPLYILNDVYDKVASVNRELVAVWRTEIVFSWRWWLNIALSILPWILWIWLRDKKNTVRLLFVGLVVALVTTFLDNLGISYNRWHYDWKVIPSIAIYLPWNLTLFPVGVMFFLQVKPQANVYKKALLYAVVAAATLEPLFVWLGLYHPVRWNSFYSFPIYFFLYLFYSFIYNCKSLRNCSSL